MRSPFAARRRPAAASAPARSRAARVTVCTALLLCVAPFALVAQRAAQKPSWPKAEVEPGVSEVRGPSWLTQLGIRLDETGLGQGAGRYGPAPDARTEAPGESLGVPQSFDISGADLYRLSCQACHAEGGGGRPPEIASLLGPIQGTSEALVRKRLQQEAGGSSSTESRRDADRAREGVLERLHSGGRRMPPRDYLEEQDTRSLLAYLTTLAGAGDAGRQPARRVSWARMGELVVKGNCHICHDATGARPSRQSMLQGAVPSLESLLATKPVLDFVHKVRAGEAVTMGASGLRHRGRMPVFHYLRDAEVAAAYVYLATYPPRPGPRQAVTPAVHENGPVLPGRVK